MEEHPYQFDPHDYPKGYEPPRKTHPVVDAVFGWAGIIAVGVALLVVTVVGISFVMSTGTGAQEAKVVLAGDTADFGDWQVTIEDPSFTETVDGKTTEGQFVTVPMKLKNLGDDRRYFPDENLRLVDDADNRYSTTEDMYHSEEALFQNPVRPSETVEGVVVFDVPDHLDIDRITVRDEKNEVAPVIFEA